MPTVLIHGPYRFFWYSADGREPPHVHVERDDKAAKFWLEPIQLERNRRFSRKDISTIRAIIASHREQWLIRWRNEFGN